MPGRFEYCSNYTQRWAHYEHSKGLLIKRGNVTKPRMRQRSKTGGLPFPIGHLRQVLTKPLYIDKARGTGNLYDGQYDAIVLGDLSERVHSKLATSAPAGWS